MKGTKCIVFLTIMTFIVTFSISTLVVLLVDSFKQEPSPEEIVWETVDEMIAEEEREESFVFNGDITREEAFEWFSSREGDFVVRKVVVKKDLESSQSLRVMVEIPKATCLLVGVITVEVKDRNISVKPLISAMALRAMDSGADLMWISDIVEVDDLFSYAGYFSLDPRMGTDNDVGTESSLLIYATIYKVL